MRAENAIMWTLGLIGIGSVVGSAAWRVTHAGKAPNSTVEKPAAAQSSSAAPRISPAERGGTVSPTFAWPDGKLGRVEIQHIRERPDAPAMQATITYEISVASLSDGQRRISFENPTPQATPGQPPPQALDLLNPPLIVDKKGTIASVDDEQALVQTLVKSVSKTPGAPPVAQLTSLMAVVVHARAHNGWDSLVATWNGMELPVQGERQTVLTDLAPTPDGPPLQITTKIRTEGFVPCTTPSGPTQCIKITSTGTPDPTSAAILAQALQEQQAAPKGVTVRFKSLETRVTLITEPATLLPHQHELERRLTVELTQGTASQVVAQVERQIQKFTYAAR